MKSDDPVATAREHRQLDYRAAYCPAGIKPGDTVRIRSIQNAFSAENATTAEVDALVNMLEPDSAN